MKGKMTIRGLSAVVTELKSIGHRVPDTARKTMRRSAERIVKRAKEYVPEDTGDLRRSIKAHFNYGFNGRLEIDITAGSNSVDAKGFVVNAHLNQYAALVHEHYENFTITPGPKTQLKMSAHPGKVGSKFLERASLEEEDKLRERMIQSITTAIHGGRSAAFDDLADISTLNTDFDE